VVSVRSDGKKTEIKFTDNGVGTVLKKQNGLQNAENRIFALKGSITFETEPGKGFQAKIVM
jgi:signal transduction histidine kinase